MPETIQTPSSHWEPHQFEVGTSMVFRLGPLTVCGTRHAREWRMSRWRDAPPLVPRSEFALVEEGDVTVPVDATVSRFAFEKSPSQLRFEPALADRKMVARPELPLFVPSGELVKLFLSTPVWLRVIAGPESGDVERVLFEEPIARPSDTWFGDNPTTGELAYASKTHARLSLDEVMWLPQRAVTEVTVVNQSARELALPRLSIPVRSLGVYEGDGGRLWTKSVRLSHSSDGSLAHLTVGSVPAAAGTVVKRSDPRDTVANRNVVRAFANLFVG